MNDPESVDVDRLAAEARRGSEDAFAMLVTAFEARIFNFLFKLVGNAHDAEDLTQDTFVKAYQGIQRLESTGSFAAWLFIIARRRALNHFRALKPTEELTDDSGIESRNPADLLAGKDEGKSIWAVARKLKPSQYEVLWLRYGEGFSVAETARVMNTNQIRVKVLLHRARNALAGHLSRHPALIGSITRMEPGSQTKHSEMRAVL